MNYFAHGFRFLDDPYFLAGTAVPDWLSVVDRRVRVRPREAEAAAAGDDDILARVARGVARHHADDARFHTTAAFAELSLTFTAAIRDRLPPDDDCKMRTCTGGMCGQQFADAGTEVNETLQMPGDCQVVVCDGAGATTSQADDGDLPVDGLECTDDVCMAGVPSNPPVTVGTPCGMDGMCDAMGQCVG